MGTFGGHALPGSFFIFFSLWAIYHILRRFYRRRAFELQITEELVPKYVNRVSFPLECGSTGCCKNRTIPLDSWLKFVACVIGIIGEVYTGFSSDWKFVHIGNAQHSTMFATFGLSGIVEVLIFYRLLKTSIQVEYMFSLVALLCEGFLFAFHLHGRTPVDVFLHMLLLGAILISIVAGMFEVHNPDKPLFALLRCWGLLVQGTWFWQVGAILYPITYWMPRWDELAKQSMPRAANLFCYHLLIDFTAIVLLAAVMSYRIGRIKTSNLSREANFIYPPHTIDPESVELQEDMNLHAVANTEERAG
ncbi:unnamed protein product [Dicrocoelium dendriticum]|nr:unnamed protein product [Dicrocoelium dendriticum]CAH8583447.1 unnamed protein product [Dicrocoelium dendriticum]